MGLFQMKNFRVCAWAFSVALLAGTWTRAHGDDKLKLSGAGWTNFGMIVQSKDTSEEKKLNNRGMLGTGAQFDLHYQATERMEIGAGLGVGSGHAIAARNTNGFYAPFGTGPYVASAFAKYSFWNEDDGKLFIQAGLFPYDYAPDNQNLGLYLLRGPLYPGFLISGFETKYVLPVANTFGFQLHHQTGNFEHDLLLLFETDWYPYWDISPAYIATYHAGKAFRIGAGINLYHAIPIDKGLTQDTIPAVKYIMKNEADTTKFDTTAIAFNGIKLMANFSFDVKALLGGEEGVFGPEDLKLYGEVGVLGLDNDKAHKKLYGDIPKRMPMMVGFNIPTFKALDRLALEVEYYGAPWIDDPSIYYHTSGNQPRPIPKSAVTDTVNKKDDIKWSVYGSRIVAEHVKLSLQVASDHSRPGLFNGYGDNKPAANHVPFFSPSDYYWTAKIAYFF
jgi:hypothetical protein